MLQTRPPRPKAVPGEFWEYTVSQSRRRPRFWAAVQLPKALLQSALLGFLFSGGKLPQLESRREKAVDSGRNGRNRHGEAMGACPGLTGKAEAAGPVFRFPRSPQA